MKPKDFPDPPKDLSGSHPGASPGPKVVFDSFGSLLCSPFFLSSIFVYFSSGFDLGYANVTQVLNIAIVSRTARGQICISGFENLA